LSKVQLRQIWKLPKEHALATGRSRAGAERIHTIEYNIITLFGGELYKLDPLLSFVIVLCFFHVSEFCLAVCYMRRDLSARCEIVTGPDH
jgi:hypothetical protein